MAQVAPKLLTFEEFESLSLPGRYELVNGRVEELVPPKPLHGWTHLRFSSAMDHYLEEHESSCYRAVEVDIPTIPFFGRRPDFIYYSPDEAEGLDLDANRVLGPPTLAVEILSEDDEDRDLVVKRREYAQARIAHYWILDPARRTVLTLALAGCTYEVASEFGYEDVLTSDLFPGLEIPLRRLFR
jgi:Uma2 family endonuclease